MDDPGTWQPARDPAGGREVDRGPGRDRWGPDVVSPDVPDSREVETSRRGPHGRGGREDAGDAELLPTPWGDDGASGDEHGVPAMRVFAPVEGLRLSRDAGETTHERIEWASHAAYTAPGPDGLWRKANVIFAYTIGPVVTILCDTIRWTCGNLARFLGGIVVTVSLCFILNQVPVVQWVIPDQWDVSNLFPHDDPELIEVPIVPPPPRGD